MKIYVGNLSYGVMGEDLEKLFEPFGQVASASIIKDKFSGKSKGFGFVEMPGNSEAQAAINGLNGKDWEGRKIVVSEARPQTDRGGQRGGRQGGGRY